MKKLILIAAVILIAGITYGQSLQKGNLVGTHTLTVSLKSGVTMEKYLEFYQTKVIPEIEKNMPTMKVYLVKGLRGENIDSFGMIIVFKSAQERDKYYNADQYKWSRLVSVLAFPIKAIVFSLYYSYLNGR